MYRTDYIKHINSEEPGQEQSGDKPSKLFTSGIDLGNQPLECFVQRSAENQPRRTSVEIQLVGYTGDMAAPLICKEIRVRSM